MSQRVIVVHDVHPASERSHDQIVVVLLDLQVAHGDDRHATLHGHPLQAAVDGGEQAEFGSAKQQIRVFVVLDDGVDGSAFGQIRRDGRPRFAAVGTLDQVRPKVAALVVVDRHEHGVRVMR